MSALLRMLALGALIYAGYAVAFPDWRGDAYAAATLSLIAGGAVGVWFLHKMLDFGEGAAKLGLELVFLGAVALWVGSTMPQKSGKPPLAQWAQGARPRRAEAQRGLRRLGVDPGGAFGRRIVSLFPR